MGIAFSIIGSISLFIIIYYTIKISKITSDVYSESFMMLLLFFNPLIWLMSNRYMPDLMGLSISLMALYYLLFDFEENQYLNYGYFLTGLLFGTRLSYVPILIIPLAYRIMKNTNKIKLIYSFTIGLCIWFIPFLYISGFENLLHVASNQTVGHFRDFGGTIFSELDWYKRFSYFIQSIWADGLGGYWSSRAFPTFITSACMIFFLYQFRYSGSWSWLKNRKYKLIIASLIIYLVWIFLFQNIIYKSRHILPVLPFAIILITLAYKYSRNHKPILSNIIATTLLFNLLLITYTLTIQHKGSTAISQLYTYLSKTNESLDIISIPLINYYLKSHGLKQNYIDINIQNPEQSNQINNISKNNIVIGEFKKLFEKKYMIIPDTIFYHNPYMNRMWSKIDTYHLVQKD
tara:strand:- start:339 stop:1550 length:1212 start_codon:yes stop_codon:yes gene_type:complete